MTGGNALPALAPKAPILDANAKHAVVVVQSVRDMPAHWLADLQRPVALTSSFSGGVTLTEPCPALASE
jgi:hypothetical protein